MVADELLYHTSGCSHIIILVCGSHIPHKRIEKRYYPPVNLRSLRKRHSLSGRIEPVDIGIQREERISVVEGSEELFPDFINSGLVKAEIVPRL